jgi:polyhydroxyalkanoate synthesis regulator phasin
MKNIRSYLGVDIIIGLLGVTGTAVATVTSKTPAEITAGLVGKTVEQVTIERAAGKTYGTIADEAGKLDEFKAQTLEQKKAILDQRVADGNLTQEQADTIYNSIMTNQAICDGTGSARIGQSMGTGFSQGQGKGLGKGQCSGQRNGGGFGGGMGRGATLNN